jgi:hypothetical protein
VGAARRRIQARLEIVKDFLVLGTLIVGFATLITVHIAVSLRLVFRARPRWRGAVALVVPPLAPIWAFREGWRGSGITWIAAVLVYVLGRIAAGR